GIGNGDVLVGEDRVGVDPGRGREPLGPDPRCRDSHRDRGGDATDLRRDRPRNGLNSLRADHHRRRRLLPRRDRGRGSSVARAATGAPKCRRWQGMSALLEVRGLTKRFGGLLANQEISFALGAGQIVGLIGPNGAGKTTLFNCIAGFYPPSNGSVLLDGSNVTGASPEKMARLGVARTFPLVRTLATMTALENVTVAALIRDKRLPTASERARAALELCGLSARASIPAGNLTVAEQRRLELARALGLEPKLLLLDEVMAGLNPAEVQ